LQPPFAGAPSTSVSFASAIVHGAGNARHWPMGGITQHLATMAAERRSSGEALMASPNTSIFVAPPSMKKRTIVRV